MKTSVVVISAVLAALSAPIIARADTAAAPTIPGEKCFGIAKAGLNDCQTPSHSCAGASVKDDEGASWIYVPVGTCAKITGGSTTPKP